MSQTAIERNVCLPECIDAASIRDGGSMTFDKEWLMVLSYIMTR